jgi:hypothetical protein
MTNDVYYKHVKSQYELLYILGYTKKKTKSGKLYSVEICIVHYKHVIFYYFCVA